MGIFSKKIKTEKKRFPVPRPEHFVDLVLPDSQNKYGYNEAWQEIETRAETSPLDSCVMAILVMTDPRANAHIERVALNVEFVVSKKMKLNESEDFIGRLARSAEIGAALAMLETADLVTPVGKMHPSVWNAIISHSFKNETSEETDIQLQARFCAALVGYYLMRKAFPTAEIAAQSIQPISYS